MTKHCAYGTALSPRAQLKLKLSGQYIHGETPSTEPYTLSSHDKITVDEALLPFFS
jgi:hypothetical protein